MISNNTGLRTFKCAANLEPYRGVKFDSNGDIVYAVAGDRPIGFTIDRGTTGNEVAVALASVAGSVQVKLAGNVTTYGAALYQRNSGEFSTSSADSAVLVGRALTIGSSGGVIEMLPNNN